MNAARRTPLIAAVPKIFFPFLVIAPGIVALGLTLHPNPGDAPLLPKVAILHLYPSDMAQNFWGAIVAWTTCLLVTLAISVMTSRRQTTNCVDWYSG